MSSPVRIVFFWGSKPVSGLKVRTPKASLETNGNGEVLLDFDGDFACFDFLAHDTWRTKRIPVLDASTIILDLRAEWNAPNYAIDAPSAPDEDIEVSINLGPRYEAHALLGRGGMGIVIKAWDKLLNRFIAIKALAEEFTTIREAQQIFLSEARSLARLAHPNLVQVHDIIEVDERALMVMELVEGINLQQLIEHDMLSHEQALWFGVEIANAIHYLHQQSYIHRDIKPANTMIRPDDSVKIIDFGLARRLDGLALRKTRVRGTPAYMSPEQFTGDVITPASDIYQLGVTLFEMFTGRLPFDRGEMAYAHRFLTPPDLQDLVDARVAAIVAHCLEKEPSDRPQSAEQVAHALYEICAAEGIAAQRNQRVSFPRLAATAAPATLPPAAIGRAQTAPRSAPRELSTAQTFEHAFEDGIAALLDKNYPEALQAFTAAHQLRPDDGRVIANLARLRELGYADNET